MYIYIYEQLRQATLLGWSYDEKVKRTVDIDYYKIRLDFKGMGEKINVLLQ